LRLSVDVFYFSCLESWVIVKFISL